MNTGLIDQIFRERFASIGPELYEEQRQVISSVLEGSNTLALMSTGAGKSLCYWIAGVALGGVTIVISPLTALIDEQALRLTDHGFEVLKLHSGESGSRQYEYLIALYNQEIQPDFIFISPERIATDGFFEYVARKIRNDIKLIVVDEAHCISQWGFDFRPFYKEIPHFIEGVFAPDRMPIVLGLTATLSNKDVEQICDDFRIVAENVIKSDKLLRHEINVSVIKVDNEDAKDEQLWQTLDDNQSEKILIYQDRKKGNRSVEDLCRKAIERGHKAAYFHADQTSDEKARIIEQFRNGNVRIVFATSAFGMGIDIPNIRGVIHYMLPESIEQYYQQIGRAGRDGRSSWAILIYSDKNIQVRKQSYIDKAFPTELDINRTYANLTSNKIGRKTFVYWDEDASKTYHYLLRSNAVRVVCKSIQKVNDFQSATPGLTGFNEIIDASKTGSIITVSKNLDKDEESITQHIFELLATRKIKPFRLPKKCFVIETENEQIPTELLLQIMQEVGERRVFRHKQFDLFVNLLDQYEDSTKLHQEIGLYLGVNRFLLGKIYETLSGEMVRSKSEVIIANILTERQIPFNYEIPLAYEGGTICPDFTIEWNGKTFYWEHLGMMDIENYYEEWSRKKAIYDSYFSDQLITSQEFSTLSRDAEDLILQHFN